LNKKLSPRGHTDQQPNLLREQQIWLLNGALIKPERSLNFLPHAKAFAREAIDMVPESLVPAASSRNRDHGQGDDRSHDRDRIGSG
jgi:hypothetical protein